MAVSPGNASIEYVKFVIKDKKYIPTLDTQKLLDSIGGTQALEIMTTLFYQEMFKNPHMEKFFMKTKVKLHANRLAFWVAEKMGGVAETEEFEYCKTDCNPNCMVSESNELLDFDSLQLREEDELSTQPTGKQLFKNNVVENGIKDCPLWVHRHPWSNEREMSRDIKNGQTLKIPQGRRGFSMHRNFIVHDRSTAHFAGWHCPKREDIKVGEHFKLDDCRIWLRLHFWACRRAGLFPKKDDDVNLKIENHLLDDSERIKSVSETVKSQFQDWYCRFLAHFVRIYENSAPMFVHNELMWSSSIQNIQKYNTDIEQGSSGMDDIIGVLNPKNATKKLSKEEQNWIRANHKWPYQ